MDKLKTYRDVSAVPKKSQIFMQKEIIKPGVHYNLEQILWCRRFSTDYLHVLRQFLKQQMFLIAITIKLLLSDVQIIRIDLCSFDL